MAEYTLFDFIQIILLLTACLSCYIAGKSKGAGEMCEMLLDERIIKSSDLDKLNKKYNK
tara:strand:+ start:4 stop:180 length:177 start_codon:yes stop_codon:yes gene_type:complete